MKEWAKKVDDDFLECGRITRTTEPKGILSVTGIQTLESGSGANGDALTFAKCIEAEGLFTENNQDMQPIWIIKCKDSYTCEKHFKKQCRRFSLHRDYFPVGRQKVCSN